MLVVTSGIVLSCYLASLSLLPAAIYCGLGDENNVQEKNNLLEYSLHRNEADRPIGTIQCSPWLPCVLKNSQVMSKFEVSSSKVSSSRVFVYKICHFFLIP